MAHPETRRLRRRSRAPRGSSLLVALVVLTVLAFMGAAALVYTGQESATAAQYQRRENLSACATAARNWMLSQFQAGARSRERLRDWKERVDMGTFWMQTGHLDEAVNGASGVGMEEIGNAQETLGFVDLTNTTVGPNGTGSSQRTYRAIATCIDKDTGASTEVEFQIRLAL